ncbi:MAG: hypothetical protein ABI954_02275 [Pyrinomonadaceae bacterium]
MPECKQYGGITRDELNLLRKELAKEDITLPDGDNVAFAGPYGIELQAVYHEAKETLKIFITKKPFFIPESEIWKIVDAGVEPFVGE